MDTLFDDCIDEQESYQEAIGEYLYGIFKELEWFLTRNRVPSTI